MPNEVTLSIVLSLCSQSMPGRTSYFVTGDFGGGANGSDSHPDVYPESLYTWENFLWASELCKIDAVTNSLKVYSLRSCKAGMQCFISYGALPNIDLLCFYGFVLENNPFDTIPVELEVPESPAKVALMERYNLVSHISFELRGFRRAHLRRPGSTGSTSHCTYGRERGPRVYWKSQA
ncbi:hypothetical protein SELMODRAFT_416932 [Selaginella moellendorffii]|uniref:Rubisco LSMT substrate-binding domain-containing protein n=1 Tax=Selaginella moellendorffii TaxID=88036 RepID=D8S0U9_SELML|nr:hypothetical protein SELMODRAFT_416932 [Selaginella moellendorffii]